MRSFLGSTCLACCLALVVDTGTALSQSSPAPRELTLPADEAPVPRPASLRAAEWRYTRQGWQTLEQLTAHRPQRSPAAASKLHPLVVGSLVFLLSLAVLLFFEEEPTGK